MRTPGLSLIVAGLVGTGVLTGYGYAKQAQVDELQRALYATQDSLSVLWGLTRGFLQTWASDTLSGSPHAMLRSPLDTTGNPPVCPGPHCPKTDTYRRFPPAPRWLRPTAH